MTEQNLLVPVVRYLVEDLTKEQFETAVSEGHIEFLARAFDMRPGELIDAVRTSRKEKALIHGFQQRMLEGGKAGV
jgi:hypothetical protein